MDIGAILVWVLIGAVAGWLAGIIVKGFGLGLVGNIVVGILGAIVGGYLFPMLGISLGGGWIDRIIYATMGAVVLLAVVKVLKKA
jgi:uncharacterized membrane protein YeaQ/YmgE (transglycosylase-associated protein family)